VTSSAKIDPMERKFDNSIKHLTSKIIVEASDLRRRIEKLEHTAKGEKKYLYRDVSELRDIVDVLSSISTPEARAENREKKAARRAFRDAIDVFDETGTRVGPPADDDEDVSA
jgi:hypothetical protein